MISYHWPDETRLRAGTRNAYIFPHSANYFADLKLLLDYPWTMCGIAGLIAQDLGSDTRRDLVAKMADRLAHRGPDDQGVWMGEAGIALSHRRLSILDLSPLGHQPMVSPSGRYVLTYNGEIYNFRELRVALEREAGLRFVSQSDTEVLLAAIETWGLTKTLPQLNGMFAFALWDIKNRSLELVRDRLGEKPLYFGRFGRQFYFASELSAFAVVGSDKLSLNANSIGDLLRHNCIPAPQSIFNEIEKLRPAHRLTISVGLESLSVGQPECYWRTPQGLTKPLQLDSTEAVEQVEALLLDSVRLRMISDVPVGAFLSGGVDSSLIAALMQKNSARPIHTFTIGFKNRHFDESDFAKQISAHLGTAHTELILSDDEILASVPEMARVYSEPFSDSSQLPTYLVAALTRRSVKVALSGDGGDEIFAGYDRYQTATQLWSKFQNVPAFLRSFAGQGLAMVEPGLLNATLDWGSGSLSFGKRGRSIGEKSVKAGHLLAAPQFEDFYAQLIAQWQKPETALRQGKATEPVRDTLRALSAEIALLRKMMITDQQNYLPDDILVKVDRATMSVGLESRIPLLDHRLVELAAELPLAQLIHNGERKWILKKISDKHIPRPLIERPKMGFGVPLGQWLRGPLRAWGDDLLSAPALKSQGIFVTDRVVELWAKHRRGRADYSHDLWPILMFQSWHEHWRSGARPGLFDQKVAI